MTAALRMLARATVALALAACPLLAAAADETSPLLTADTTNGAGCLSLAASLAGDINGDKYVNVGDLQLLVATWGKAYGDPGFNPEADFNCDQEINVSDLLILVIHWGTSQP